MIAWIVNYRPYMRQAPQSRASLSSTFQPPNVPTFQLSGFRIFFPSSVSCNSFVCHSCENCRGGYQKFPNRNVTALAGWKFRLLPERNVQALLESHSPAYVRKESPLAATFMRLPTSVANKRLTVWLNPLDAT